MQVLKTQKELMAERLLNLAVRCIELTKSLSHSGIDRSILSQLQRASSSAGANYEEACGAESRKDFVHKLQLVLKELKETIYWLKLLERVSLPVNQATIKLILEDSESLSRIVGKSVVTAKKNGITQKNTAALA